MDELYLAHSGKAHDENPPGRGSGLYPWGSGKRPHQHDWDTKARIDKLRAMGWDDKKIAEAMGYTSVNQYTHEEEPSVSRLKAEYSIATNNVKADDYEAILWFDSHTNPKTGKPYTNREIAEEMGWPNESTVRTKRETGFSSDDNPILKAANTLKEATDETGYLDVGKGTELFLDVSPDRLNYSLEVLKKEGYEVRTLQQEQNNGSGQKTNKKILIAPDKVGEDEKELYQNAYDALKKGEIKRLKDEDEEANPLSDKVYKWEDPIKVPLNDVKILYDEDGGREKDGIIEIRAKVMPDGSIRAVDPQFDLGLNMAGEPSRYAQVRIKVDGGKECITDDNPTGEKYIKGMAVYNVDLPEGTNILVNSNKSVEGGPAKALKDIETDKGSPFGASVVQQHYVDPKDGKTKLSAIQIVGTVTDDDHDRHTEGAWGEWSKNLPSQFLAKQDISLVKKQLKAASMLKEDEYETIMSIKQPTIRKKLLEEFGDSCDKAAEDLKAAPIPGQRTHVLLADKSIKDTECYAPNYETGQKLALVRFPHTGPFEIAEVTVNNNLRNAKAEVGKNPLDVIVINKTVANKLSGADFDGDNVIAIPMTRKSASGGFEKNAKIKTADTLPGLKDFDTEEYGLSNPRFKDMVDAKGKPTYKVFKTDKDKGREMGVISNLITDMYAKGCDDPDELERAVKYSMVVIDAKKHKLNYKQAEKDYGIQELKEKYQMNPNGHAGGASSLLSKSKSQAQVDKRGSTYIDPETGERKYRAPKVTEKATSKPVYVKNPDTGKYLKDKNGKKIQETWDGELKKDKDGNYSYDPGSGKKKYTQGPVKKLTDTTTKMQATTDARTLLSENPNEIEKTYADYANHMKSLANKARKESVLTQEIKADPVAAKEYADEVASLNNKLIKAKKNSAREREAQMLCTSRVNAIMDAHPDKYQDYDDVKKLRDRTLKEARIDCNAQKDRVVFTENEWKAIENNAISPTKLNDLLRNADTDSYKKMALPKSNSISAAKKSRIKQLYSQGYSQEEIARMVDGVSQSSISSIVNG